ncbi:hypothetical protein Tco_1401380 [Tanacetum coccineum]
MKLNPKKCTFGVEEGMFLCHVINMKGIKACPDKAEAVIKLQSPRMLKEVQSLNGKLASLNRFLSKSAEKSLPFFKTLKNCIKKSDFQWTAEAEKAFQDMKRCIADLLMVTAPRPKEEMIIYLCAAREAVSSENKLELNGKTSVSPGERFKKAEKIFPSPSDSKAFDITYRPRTSIHGQVLADFITERPDGQVLADFITERPDEDGPLIEIQVEEAAY